MTDDTILLNKAIEVLESLFGNSSSSYGLAWAVVRAHLSQPQPVAQCHVSNDCDGDPVWSFANRDSIYSIVLHPEGHQLIHTDGGELKLISKPFNLVAQGEAVDLDIEWPEFHQQCMGCGLEDRGITDRYDAMRYGWDEALAACANAFKNATPTIPAGHKVVPDGLEKDAARYQWLRDRLCVRWEMALDGEKHEAIGMRPGFGFLRSTMDPAKGWTLPEFFDDHRQKTDNAIDKAMLAAAPGAGGV